jgi:zinc transport system substrate-binding protein
MNIKIVVGLVLLIAAVGGLVLMGRRPTADSQRLRVVTSFYPLYFFASEIGGDRAEVLNITPAGAEPHDYEPTAQDIADIERANLIVLNGGGLEAWGDKIKQVIDPRKTLVVTVGDGLATAQVEEDGETVVDPHVWLSPVLASQMVDKIAISLMQSDPANAVYYEGNAAALKVKLADLDTAYRAGLAQCAKKDFITSHAAFGYIASSYALRQVPISGLSPDAEPSAKQLIEVAQFARQNDVKYIFFEELVSPKLSQTIATEVGAQTLVLDPLEGLAAEDIAAGKNYLTVMQENLANLKTALQCQ